MAKQTINIGTTANDRTGDHLRSAMTKVNSNFTELYDADTTAGAYTLTAFNRANAAFTQANTGTSLANSSYNQANSSYNQANSAYDLANTGTSLANSAYSQANTSTLLAQAAYNYANSIVSVTTAEQLLSNTNATITAGPVGNAYVWQFGTDGSLTIPADGIIQDSNSDTVIMLSVLKSVVANSIGFVDFQSRIAAL